MHVQEGPHKLTYYQLVCTGPVYRFPEITTTTKDDVLSFVHTARHVIFCENVAIPFQKMNDQSLFLCPGHRSNRPRTQIYLLFGRCKAQSAFWRKLTGTPTGCSRRKYERGFACDSVKVTLVMYARGHNGQCTNNIWKPHVGQLIWTKI